MSPPSPEPATAIEGQKIEAPKLERPAMSVDIACVGFGPAMGGFLATLSRSLLNRGAESGQAGKAIRSTRSLHLVSKDSHALIIALYQGRVERG